MQPHKVPLLERDIFQAVTQGDLMMVKKHIKKNRSLLYMHNKQQDTLLWLAVNHNQKEIFIFLLNCGASVLEKNSAGVSVQEYLMTCPQSDPLRQAFDKANEPPWWSCFCCVMPPPIRFASAQPVKESATHFALDPWVMESKV